MSEVWAGCPNFGHSTSCRILRHCVAKHFRLKGGGSIGGLHIKLLHSLNSSAYDTFQSSSSDHTHVAQVALKYFFPRNVFLCEISNIVEFVYYPAQFGKVQTDLRICLLKIASQHMYMLPAKWIS